MLKDFFRELPEPLFTNGLYQMLLDAMTVQIADDPHGNAVIMLGIIDCLPSVHQVQASFTPHLPTPFTLFERYSFVQFHIGFSLVLQLICFLSFTYSE